MQAWENFLKVLEKELGVETTDKWLRNLRVVDFDAMNLYLEAKDAFQVMWFEEHIRKKADQLVNNNQRKIKIHIATKNSQKNLKKPTLKKGEEPPPGFILSFDELDPLLTFENFVPSECNLLAYKLLCKISNYDSVSKQVIPSSGELASFNPIYLFGGHGTGKTHLLMATAHALQTRGLKILYVRAETFTEHVVTAIRAGEMSIFRHAYRNVDILFIDDVQVFSRKGATQEELFHTFNTLHLGGKQIVLSANCSPLELQYIEARLVSRFEWGIVLPLETLPEPDIKKVLEAKANAYGSPLHPKVEEFLIETFTTNTKSLTRALEALILRHHLKLKEQNKPPQPITVQTVKYLLKDFIDQEAQKALTPEKIIQTVAEYYGIKTEDIFSKTQRRETVLPRQIAMFFCRNRLGIPFTKIGELFSKDHSTVMSSVRLIQEGVECNNKEIAAAHHGIAKKLNP